MPHAIDGLAPHLAAIEQALRDDDPAALARQADALRQALLQVVAPANARPDDAARAAAGAAACAAAGAALPRLRRLLQRTQVRATAAGRVAQLLRPEGPGPALYDPAGHRLSDRTGQSLVV